MLKGESTGASFIERYETLRKNLGALKDRLLNITEQEKKDLEVRAEHSLTARDLLAVVESSIGDRFDEQVLFALNERRVNRLENVTSKGSTARFNRATKKSLVLFSRKFTLRRVSMVLTNRMTMLLVRATSTTTLLPIFRTRLSINTSPTMALLHTDFLKSRV